MEQLRPLSYERIERADTTLKRYLYHTIDWDDRLIAILGARGSGKTTLILQYARENRDLSKTLYLSLDHILFQNQRLLDVVDFYHKLGIRYFTFFTSMYSFFPVQKIFLYRKKLKKRRKEQVKDNPIETILQIRFESG